MKSTAISRPGRGGPIRGRDRSGLWSGPIFGRPAGYPAVVTTERFDWPAMLLALDEPISPSSHQGPGQGDGLEVPRDFDYGAAKSRFDRLAARLSGAFGSVCDHGQPQDSACFGSIWIPAEATRTRAKHTREPFAVEVLVSSFGGLATYRALNVTWGQVVPVHQDDARRIEEALVGLGYLVVPMDVLDTRYDGPNGWVFGSSPYEKTDATWFIRYFDYL